jgi:hypothetical protein
VKNVLDKNGLFIIQMSYTPLMLKQLAFDNICHEHLEYYSLSSLKFLLEKHDLKVVDLNHSSTPPDLLIHVYPTLASLQWRYTITRLVYFKGLFLSKNTKYDKV